MTVFYAAVLPEYLCEVTDLWSHLMRPSLRDDDFNMEKNVIKEEIAMYQDLPNFDVMDRCRSMHFEGHPCGHSVLGSVESIDKLSAVQMRSYFNNRYAPNNMTLTVVGNFEWDKVTDLAQSLCNKWQKQPVSRETSHFEGSFKKQRIIKANLASEHICLISSGVSAQDPRRFAAHLLATIIGDTCGSRYFWELVDKAIAQCAYMQYAPMDGTGALYSYFQCNKENANTVIEKTNKIFSEISGKGVTEDELTKAKNKILSSLVIKNELPMGRLVDVGFNWIYNSEYLTVEQDMDAIRQVSTEDIKLLIDDIQPAQYTHFSIGPE
nr:insulinase family protein [Planctomycetota bacterium]